MFACNLEILTTRKTLYSIFINDNKMAILKNLFSIRDPSSKTSQYTVIQCVDLKWEKYNTGASDLGAAASN